MRLRRLLPVVIALVAAVLVVTSLYATGTYPFHRAAPPASPAPDFTLTDINGQNVSLSEFRGSSVVLLEFTSVDCSECQYLEKTYLDGMYANYNRTGHSEVQILSIFVSPQTLDSVSAVRQYQQQQDITWYLARDTSTDAVSTSYGLDGVIPNVFIIDKRGYAVYHQAGTQTPSAIQGAIDSALAGTAAPISIVAVSVFALAAIAGVTTFFSPCAFPMFPGYMSLFLGLDTARAAGAAESPGSYGRATRRALGAGSVTALGMMIVFLVLGIILILTENAISRYVPELLLAVGGALIVLGLLLFTNLQYWRIITPFQTLARRLRGGGSEPAAVVTSTTANEKGLYLKLFSYGLGYAAAAAGCVAPVIFSAIFAGLALGPVGGIVTVLIFSATAALLMIVVTVVLALAGNRFVNQLKAFTPVIKKVSAAVLVVVGVYLIYFYYTSWVA